MVRNNKVWIGFLLTFLGSILFSTKAVFVKLAFASTSVDAVTLLALRMFFSMPVFLVVAFLYSRRESNIRFSRKQWMQIIFLGLIGYYASSLFDFIGLQYISASLERLILFLYPTFAVLLNAFVYKQAVSGRQKWALLLTYSGILLAFFGEMQWEAGDRNFYIGSFFVFLCAVCFAIYLVGSGRVIPVVGATKFTAYAMTIAGIAILLHFLIKGTRVPVMTSSLITYSLLLAIVATVIPIFLMSNGLKRIGSNNAAIVSSIGPVSTILQAHFVLGEKFGWVQAAGTLLVVSGVVLIGWRSREI